MAETRRRWFPCLSQWRHLGFIIVPTGYTHEKIVQGHGTPYGASSVSGQNSSPPTTHDLEVAKHQGARVTQVAAALKAAR